MLINCKSCGETVRITTRLTKHCKNRSCLSKFINGDIITFEPAHHETMNLLSQHHEKGNAFKLIQGIYFRIDFKSELEKLIDDENVYVIKAR